jgi:hypothetical protein
MHEIFFDPARSLRNCSGSRVFLWGARAASLRVSAASRNGLSTSACSGRIHNTSPVEDSPWRARTLTSRQNELSGIGEHTRLACNASPARTLGTLAERTLSNRTRTLHPPRKRTFLRVFLRDCAIAVSRLYHASSPRMSITRTSAGNSPSPLIAASSPADSKLDR